MEIPQTWSNYKFNQVYCYRRSILWQPVFSNNSSTKCIMQMRTRQNNKERIMQEMAKTANRNNSCILKTANHTHCWVPLRPHHHWHQTGTGRHLCQHLNNHHSNNHNNRFDFTCFNPNHRLRQQFFPICSCAPSLLHSTQFHHHRCL